MNTLLKIIYLLFKYGPDSTCKSELLENEKTGLRNHFVIAKALTIITNMTN